MSNMNRLRELAALLRPSPVVEAKIPQGFDGISSVVRDAVADLEDKLGEGGSLETMIDKFGLSDMAGSTLTSMYKALATFKKEVDSCLTECEMMIHMVQEDQSHPEPVMEMAKASDFQGGAFARKGAKQLIAAFRAGEDSFDLKDGTKYVFDKPTSGGTLKKDDIVFASHDKYNTGAQLYQVLGFGGDDEKVKYDTVKDALKATGTSNLKELEKYNDEQKDRSEEVRLIVKDLNDGDSGAWFYLYKGRWAYGSGAEPLTFSLVKKV